MSASFLHSSHKVIRYKNLKNKAEDEKQQDAEILISSVMEENESSARDKRKRFSYLKVFYNPVSILIVVVLFFLVVAALYYYCTNTIQTNFSLDRNNSSSNISCVPLRKVSKLIILIEKIDDYNTCSDNTTCHSLLHTIEHEHDGLKYNFVIGPEGELYIGSGFNCLVSGNESALYVKLLQSSDEDWTKQYLEARSRLSEIIDHGILCEKISQDYETLVKIKHSSGVVTEKYLTEKWCNGLECGKNRPYHVHDPGHEMKTLLQSGFGWTFCGNFSNTMSIKEGKVIRMESLPKHSCPPLHLVDKITVDVVTTPTSNCSDDSSCLRTYEENHDGFKYNFIIGHNNEVYVGLGFKCKAENTTGNILKMKMLRTPDQEHSRLTELLKLLQIIDEGIACGKVSKMFSVKPNCNISKELVHYCITSYEQFNDKPEAEYWFNLLNYLLPYFNYNHYSIISEHGKGIVPNTFRYQFCPRIHKHEQSTFMSEPTSQTNTTDNLIFYFNNTSCIPFKKVKRVILITEKTDYNYSCSNNGTCPSLLETIEHEHDGLRYNFVIGPRGELYIGSGFKCLINGDKSVLYIKILKPEGLFTKEYHSAVCLRLSEIIDHGILCEKISHNYTTLNQFNSEYNIRVTEEPSRKLCPTLDTGMYPKYYVHDPKYGMRTLIDRNVLWTFCGNLSSSTNIEKSRVITMDSVPKQSCLPLQIVDLITVDVVVMPEFSCSNDSSCLDTFEKDHDGFKFNFIIGHDNDLYVGLGFNCRTENSSGNMLKVKVLGTPGERYTGSPFDPGTIRLIQIIDEGIICGQISDTFRIEANCNIDNQYEIDHCRYSYEYFSNSFKLHFWIDILAIHTVYTYYNISSEHGRGIVPNMFRYQFCSKNQSYETTTIESELSSTSDYISTHSVGNPYYDYSYVDI